MIQVCDLSFSYGNRQVLRDISFSIAVGQLFSVLGMNGAGKTTLLKTISGLLRPTAGTICVNSREIATMSRMEMARSVGYLPQNTGVLDCSVFEAVLIGRKPHLNWQVSGDDLAEVTRMLDLTGLSQLADRPVCQLSGGELQRVAIARTLAQRPALLLLDEPVNHLDLRSQLEIMALIRTLTSQLGIITIVVIHDLNVAMRFSDGFLLLKEGAVLAAGGKELMTSELLTATYGLTVELHQVGGMTLVVPGLDQETLLPQSNR